MKIGQILLLCTFFAPFSSFAEEQKSATGLDKISNYREYTDKFSSSGQPTIKDLHVISDADFERIIYLAFSDDQTAIPAEDRLVRNHGMQYVQLPVDFSNPTLQDFQAFLAIMRTNPDAKTLLHCQVNFRASTFSLLYRVIELGVPIGEAKVAFESVWQPNETWFRFLVTVLEHYDLSHSCDDCDWGELDFIE
jgi:protein tyrosine phosphatase (PTP) superfamily phosphohydrolase (DUF442 family)